MRNPLSQCSRCSAVILYTISTTRLSNRIFQTASSGCKWMPRGALVCSPPRASGSEERTRTARPWTWSLMPNVQQGCDTRFGGAFSKGCPSFFFPATNGSELTATPATHSGLFSAYPRPGSGQSVGQASPITAWGVPFLDVPRQIPFSLPDCPSRFVT